MTTPEQMTWLFWDVDVENLDVERDEIYLMARVLERGRISDVQWVMETYGIDRIRRFFEEVGHPEISRRTLSFWKAYFKTKGETWATPRSFRLSSSIPWPS